MAGKPPPQFQQPLTLHPDVIELVDGWLDRLERILAEGTGEISDSSSSIKSASETIRRAAGTMCDAACQMGS